MKMFGPVYSEPIASARADVGGTGEIPVLLRVQGMKCPLRIFRRAFFQNQFNMLRFRRPNTKMCLVRPDQFRTDRVAPFCQRHYVSIRLSNRFGSLSVRVEPR